MVGTGEWRRDREGCPPRRRAARVNARALWNRFERDPSPSSRAAGFATRPGRCYATFLPPRYTSTAYASDGGMMFRECRAAARYRMLRCRLPFKTPADAATADARRSRASKTKSRQRFFKEGGIMPPAVRGCAARRMRSRKRSARRKGSANARGWRAAPANRLPHSRPASNRARVSRF